MPRLYFVDCFLENLTNADSENTRMRKADSTAWTAGGFPSSHIPCHLALPSPTHSHTVHCYYLWSLFIYILLGTYISKGDWVWVVFPFLPQSVIFFLQLLIFVIWGGMILRLMKANAHLNTEYGVFMPPFFLIHLEFLHHCKWLFL